MIIKVGLSRRYSEKRSDSSAMIKRLKRTKTCHFLFLFLFLTMGLSTMTAGWSQPALAEEELTNPGDTNPIQSNMLFRDEELLEWHFQSENSLCEQDTYLKKPGADDLSSWTQTKQIQSLNCSTYSGPGIIETGRIDEPTHDQVARVMHLSSGKLEIALLDPKRGFNSPVRSASLAEDMPWARDEFMDIAVGDLDLFVDENGFYHDEIVIAHVTSYTSGTVLQVTVLDYNLNTLAVGSIPYHTNSDPGTSRGDGVAVALGDFDGDRKLEIAVATKEAYTKCTVAMGRLTYHDASGTYSIDFQNPYTHTFSRYYDWNSLDLAAGDFAGTGKAQLLLAEGIGTYLFEADSSLNVIYKTSYLLVLSYYADYMNGGVRIKPGLFHYDPANGFDVNRSQIAYAVQWNQDNCYGSYWPCDGSAKITVGILEYDGQYLHRLAEKEDYLPGDIGAPKDDADLSLAVGNFVGHGQSGEATSPTMQIAACGTVTPGVYSSSHYWRLWTVSQDAKTLTAVSSQCGKATYGGYRTYSVVATDADGDSWRLGPPIHMSVKGLAQLNNVIQEPPKHLDYLPTNPDSPESDWIWDVINVNTSKEFYVEMGVTTSDALTTTKKSQSSYDIGGAASLDYQATVSAGFCKIARETITSSASVKAGYQYESSQSQIDSSYTEVTETKNVFTELDDYLTGKYQDMDIWLYPILGYMTDDPDNPYGYYQVVVPGAEFPFGGAGLGINEYHPLHENHNILSYPPYNPDLNRIWTPPDLGSFTIPGSEDPVTDIMNSQESIILGGTKTDKSLTFTTKAGSESEKSYSNTLSESLDLSFSSKSEVKIPGIANAEVDIATKFNLNSKQSWGGSETAKQETSGTKGMKILSPAMRDGTKGYAFTSAAYVSSGGGMFKVAHAVDPLGSVNGELWWKKQYGKKPDPALNLPNRFLLHKMQGDELEDYYILNPNESKYNIRGFFLRDGEVNPVTGEHEYLSGNPSDGDIVQLCVRVYNYSFVDTGPFEVKFYYVLWDCLSGMMVGEPVSQPGMTAEVSNLNGVITPNGETMKEVCVNWDTTGLNNTGDPNYGYRFIVHIDEKNEVNEIHEGWKDAALSVEAEGGNNVGYFPWSNPIFVGPPPTAQAMAREIPKPVMVEDALAVETEGGLESTGTVFLKTGEHYRLRAHINTETTHPHNFIALFYDGDPKQGGTLIASELVRGLPPGDAYIWTTWTPNTSGKRDIWAHIVGDLRYADRQNAWDSVTVMVSDADDDNDSSPCFISTAGSGK